MTALTQPGQKLRLGILLSGRGSNFLAIHAAIAAGQLPNAEITVVISNIPDAPGLAAARKLNLPTALHISRGQTREVHDAACLQTLLDHNVDLICLAGYMRLLSPFFIQAFPNKIINIHPSLLPAFTGLHAQQQAFDYGVKLAGCTVHFVDEHLDHGVIILQRAIPVLPADTADTLASRILIEEHVAYIEALALISSGHYEIRGRQFLPNSR
jgi:phosphoribosylglycinamide formyltransferase 1